MNYKKEDVIPRAVGSWQEIISTITNVDSKVFNGKHQACPSCGGKDRFRFDNERSFKGDGGYICSSCGGGDGFDLLCKISRIGFSEAVNLVGEILGGQSPERQYEVKQEIKHSSNQERYSDYMDDAEVRSLIDQCSEHSDSKVTRQHGVVADKILTIKARDGVSMVLPLVFDRTPDLYCGVAMVNSGEFFGEFSVSYAKGTQPAGGVYVIPNRKGQSGTVVLVESWINGLHASISTGLEVWVCLSPENMNQDRKSVV